MNLRILLSLIAMILVSNFALANVHTGIEVKLQAVKSNVKNDENIYVKVSLKNRTSENINILKWYLPNEFNELEEGIFKITRDGESIPYLGRHYKRPAPIGDDYLVLKANQAMNFKVELSGVYDFSEEGFYSINFSVANLALFSHKMNGRSHSAASRMIADNVAEIYVQKVTSR
ncbi:MAG: peptidase M35, partial [Gammaproteobacteria bacterium]